MKRIRRRPPRQENASDSVFPFLSRPRSVIAQTSPGRHRPDVRGKGPIISDMNAVRAQILDLARSIQAGKQEQVFLGVWTIRDLIAHLIGWDQALLAAAQETLEGVTPTIYQMRDEDWTGLNFQFVRQFNRGTYAELLRAVETSHADLLAFLESITEDEFIAEHGVSYDGSPVTIARLMSAELEDEQEHLAQIAEWTTRA